MTIPQMITAAGWAMVLIAISFFYFEYEDSMFDHLFGTTPQWKIGLPLFIVGLILGVGGLFAEQIHEEWIRRRRSNDDDLV